MIRAFSLLAIATIIAGCDSRARDPRLDLGWVTNCTGPAFPKFDNSLPDPDQPGFRITDQLLLAVPKQNGPDTPGIDRVPEKCTKISGLPQPKFLGFLIQRNWSAGYSLADVPTVGAAGGISTESDSLC